MEIAGVVLLCDGASPLAANAYGAGLLESQDWPRMHAEIRNRLRPDSGGAVFGLARMKGQAPWIVWLTRLSERPAGPNGWHLCFVFDFERQPDVAMGVLREAFRLTRAEMRLVEQILLGKTPAEAAEALGVTIHTVRTYLKRLYHKVGARSQATLVRKLIQASSLPVLLAA
jgi:DNA-binding CsgD family transcriptional regulator